MESIHEITLETVKYLLVKWQAMDWGRLSPGQLYPLMMMMMIHY